MCNHGGPLATPVPVTEDPVDRLATCTPGNLFKITGTDPTNSFQRPQARIELA
jgi:hypothetical protein